MLQIHIGSIPPETGENFEEQVEACRLPLLKAVSEDGSIRFVQPVHVRIYAKVAGESVGLDGSVETTVRLFCSRCLSSFELRIATDFTVTALPEAFDTDPVAAPDEIELSGDELDTVTYQGEVIDLRNEIGQQIIMALPFKPLCREACKGLCSHCGADLNRTSCRCHLHNQSSPFDVLKKLSLPPKKDL